ncbi:Ankyrin-3 [Colletotrichum fructicola]|nr:Ankyrin-3 [Colletotrichum fructicola]
MASGDEASGEEIQQTTLSTVDKSDSSDSGESIDDTIDVEQSPLRSLLLEISRDEDPSSDANLVKLRDLLGNSSEVNAHYANGETALHIAARYDLIEAAKKLIKAGANISAKDEDGRQPLHRACFEGHVELAEVLIREGATIEAKQHSDATPLDDACWQGHIDVVKLLLKEGADTQVIDKDGWSPLYSASRYGHSEIVKCLLGKDHSNINQPERRGGWTALRAAIEHRHADVVSVLIDLGAKLEIKDKKGRTPLLSASIDGFSEGATRLIAGGANCNARTGNSKSTPLIAASSWGYQEIVEALLDPNNPNGPADVDLQDTDGWTALHAAIIGEHSDIAELLLEREANVYLMDSDGQTALHLASERGNVSVVKLLLEREVLVDLKDNDGQTALHLASDATEEDQSYQNPDRMEPSDPTFDEEHSEESQFGRYGAIIRHLLNGGASLGAQNKEGKTPLHLAAASGDIKRFKLFLRWIMEEDLLTLTAERRAALYFALRGDRRETTMETLLESKKLVEEDVLIWAAGNSETHDIAKWLLQKRPKETGATQNAGPEDWSAIKWAAHAQHPRALSLLISSSPRTEAAGEERESALISILNELAKNPNEGAARAKLHQVLWLLMTTSEKTDRIDAAIEPALKSVDKLRNPPQSLSQPQKLQISDISKVNPSGNQGQSEKSNLKKGGDEIETGHNIQRIEPTQKSAKALQSKDLKTIKDLLSEPPFGIAQILSDSTEYQLPQPKDDDDVREILKSLEAQATIVQFYKGEGVSVTIRRDRPVQKLVYDSGPTEIMQTVTNMQNAIANLSSVVVDDSEIGPEFTWVHLPSTNMEWMNDLLTRIMKDENRKTSEYNQLQSFFRDSWTEVPDRETPSRIMRPRTAFTRQNSGTDENRDKDGKTKERLKKAEKARKEEDRSVKEGEESQKEGEKSHEGSACQRKKVEDTRNKPYSGNRQLKATVLDASAIYMPYLCFSTYRGKVPAREEDGLAGKDGPYDKLLKAYDKGSGAHESPTLDEWYYHFATDEKSEEDKKHRNETQIVTKFQAKYMRRLRFGKGEPVEPRPEQLALLRVNQLWVWTIDNKWLITATSCLLDDKPRTLVDEILCQLEKKVEYGGTWSQPQSVLDMSKLLIEYCVGSYERKPESDCPVSIAQTFSNHVNEIGREETTLLDDFSHRTQDRPERPHSKEEEKAEKTSSRKGTQEEASNESSPDKTIKNAIGKAERLYCSIKDVRDELNILKSVAGYQKIVQRGLFGNKVKDADLTAAYVVNELEELDIIADRIQSSVRFTLVLISIA